MSNPESQGRTGAPQNGAWTQTAAPKSTEQALLIQGDAHNAILNAIIGAIAASTDAASLQANLVALNLSALSNISFR